jgi:AmiR/NasT family two-component response regulator
MNNGDFGPTAEVAQAQGMVSVQADCSLEEALELMRDRATVTHQTLDEIADAVLDRSIRFGP